jgi:hypothetical protein
MIIYGRLHKILKRGIKDNNNNNTQIYANKTILPIYINTVLDRHNPLKRITFYNFYLNKAQSQKVLTFAIDLFFRNPKLQQQRSSKCSDGSGERLFHRVAMEYNYAGIE